VSGPAEYLPAIQRTPEWLEARQHGIGASECAAAIGLSRWESPYSLWARKCGLVPPPESNLAMEIGTITEPLNAARYAEATGAAVRRVNRLMRSREYPFMLASLDRRRADGRLVELKWTERGDGYGEPGTDQVPDEVLCQTIHQMAVSGSPAVDVSVIFGAKRHAIYTVERDAAAEARVIEREAILWQHVEDRTEPALDGSDATLRALGLLYPVDEPDAPLVEASSDATDALAALLDIRDAVAVHATAMRSLEESGKPLRALLELAIGSAPGLVAPGLGRISWKASAPSLDWQATATALHAELREVLGTATPLAEIASAHRKKPARPFLPSREKEDNHE
jgi:putative phage-type endonuclease